MKKPLPKRLQPSDLNSFFDSEKASFSEYIAKMRTMITKARTDLTGPLAEKIIEANLPFEWIPQDPEFINPRTGKIRNGILLIHGLLDSPSLLHSLRDFFKKKGFLVRAILLPGHGTVPGDLITIKHQEWLKATEYGINSFKDQVDHFYLLGFSTGGCLAVYYALQNTNPPVSGIFLFSAAIKLKRSITQLAYLLTKFRRSFNWVFERIQWFVICDDRDYAKYESIAFNGPTEVYLLAKKLEALYSKKKVEIPIFAVASVDDEVVDTATTIKFFQQQPNPKNTLILYTTRNVSYEDPRIQQVNSFLPEEHIINFSHQSTMISPDHPHYGKNGDYQPDELPTIRTLKKIDTTQPIYRGAISLENMKKYTLYRLTYNPLYNQMIDALNNFLVTSP